MTIINNHKESFIHYLFNLIIFLIVILILGNSSFTFNAIHAVNATSNHPHDIYGIKREEMINKKNIDEDDIVSHSSMSPSSIPLSLSMIESNNLINQLNAEQMNLEQMQTFFTQSGRKDEIIYISPILTAIKNQGEYFQFINIDHHHHYDHDHSSLIKGSKKTKAKNKLKKKKKKVESSKVKDQINRSSTTATINEQADEITQTIINSIIVSNNNNKREQERDESALATFLHSHPHPYFPISHQNEINNRLISSNLINSLDFPIPLISEPILTLPFESQSDSLFFDFQQEFANLVKQVENQKIKQEPKEQQPKTEIEGMEKQKETDKEEIREKEKTDKIEPKEQQKETDKIEPKEQQQKEPIKSSSKESEIQKPLFTTDNHVNKNTSPFIIPSSSHPPPSPLLSSLPFFNVFNDIIIVQRENDKIKVIKEKEVEMEITKSLTQIKDIKNENDKLEQKRQSIINEMNSVINTDSNIVNSTSTSTFIPIPAIIDIDTDNVIQTLPLTITDKRGRGRDKDQNKPDTLTTITLPSKDKDKNKKKKHKQNEKRKELGIETENITLITPSSPSHSTIATTINPIYSFFQVFHDMKMTELNKSQQIINNSIQSNRIKLKSLERTITNLTKSLNAITKQTTDTIKDNKITENKKHSNTRKRKRSLIQQPPTNTKRIKTRIKENQNKNKRKRKKTKRRIKAAMKKTKRRAKRESRKKMIKEQERKDKERKRQKQQIKIKIKRQRQEQNHQELANIIMSGRFDIDKHIKIPRLERNDLFLRRKKRLSPSTSSTISSSDPFKLDLKKISSESELILVVIHPEKHGMKLTDNNSNNNNNESSLSFYIDFNNMNNLMDTIFNNDNNDSNKNKNKRKRINNILMRIIKSKKRIAYRVIRDDVIIKNLLINKRKMSPSSFTTKLEALRIKRLLLLSSLTMRHAR